MTCFVPVCSVVENEDEDLRDELKGGVLRGGAWAWQATSRRWLVHDRETRVVLAYGTPNEGEEDLDTEARIACACDLCVQDRQMLVLGIVRRSTSRIRVLDVAASGETVCGVDVNAEVTSLVEASPPSLRVKRTDEHGLISRTLVLGTREGTIFTLEMTYSVVGERLDVTSAEVNPMQWFPHEAWEVTCLSCGQAQWAAGSSNGNVDIFSLDPPERLCEVHVCENNERMGSLFIQQAPGRVVLLWVGIGNDQDALNLVRVYELKKEEEASWSARVIREFQCDMIGRLPARLVNVYPVHTEIPSATAVMVWDGYMGNTSEMVLLEVVDALDPSQEKRAHFTIDLGPEATGGDVGRMLGFYVDGMREDSRRTRVHFLKGWVFGERGAIDVTLHSPMEMLLSSLQAEKLALKPAELYKKMQQVELLPIAYDPIAEADPIHQQKEVLETLLRFDMFPLITECIAFLTTEGDLINGNTDDDDNTHTLTPRTLLHWARGSLATLQQDYRRMYPTVMYEERLVDATVIDEVASFLSRVSGLHHIFRALLQLQQLMETTQQGRTALEQDVDEVFLSAEFLELFGWVLRFPSLFGPEIAASLRTLHHTCSQRRDILASSQRSSERPVLFVDRLTREFGEEGAFTYPPQSLGDILSLFDCGTPSDVEPKQRLMFYLLVDLLHMERQQHYETLVVAVEDFAKTFSLTEGLQYFLWGIFWLDCCAHTREACEYLLRPQALVEWPCEIVEVLLDLGNVPDALALYRVKMAPTPLTSTKEMLIACRVLLAGGLLQEAFMLQRRACEGSREQRDMLLKQIVSWCETEKRMKELLRMPLTVEEEGTIFDSAQGSDTLRVIYLLQQCRYEEAMDWHKRGTYDVSGTIPHRTPVDNIVELHKKMCSATHWNSHEEGLPEKAAAEPLLRTPRIHATRTEGKQTTPLPFSMNRFTARRGVQGFVRDVDMEDSEERDTEDEDNVSSAAGVSPVFIHRRR